MQWAPDSTDLWAPDSERRRAWASDSDGHLTLIQAIDLFLAAKAAEGISPKTATWYRMILARLGRAFESDQGVDGLTAPALRGWIVGLQATLAPVSIAGYVRTLKAFGNWLHAEELAMPFRHKYEAAVELRVVRYFLAVVDEGSVTRAAAAVRVAQPSLSRQLRQLEDTLGLQLFVRARGRMRLSPAGRQFLPYARDLVARADGAIAAMREPLATRSVSLTIVSHHTTVADVIAPFLATLGSEALKVTVHVAPSFAVFKAVLSGDADLGMAMGPPPGELASRAIGSFSVWAQVPPDHRWADRPRVTIEELVAEPLVLPTPEHGTRRLFDQAVNDAGLKYRMVAEAVVSEVVQTLAAGSLGIAVVSDDERYGLHSMAIEIGGRDLRFELYAAWDPTHFAAETIGAWAERLAAFTATA